MRIKVFLSFLCLVMLLLSIGVMDVQADDCTSYRTDYLNKVNAFNSALKKLQRLEVAYRKALPGNRRIPSNLKHLEGEYNSDPDGFYKTLEGMGVALPGWLTGPLSDLQKLEISRAHSDATAAYDTAKAALAVAKTALENCTGMSVDTIWCERGTNCKKKPGVQDNPKAHYVFDCPDEIDGLLGINIDCLEHGGVVMARTRVFGVQIM